MFLTDAAFLGFEALSFCLMLFLLSAWGVETIWNEFGRHSPRLPRLSFRWALGLVAMGGLVGLPAVMLCSVDRRGIFPGIWRTASSASASGETSAGPDESSRLDAGEVAATIDSEPIRRSRLELLKQELWRFARAHEGRFPATPSESNLPDATWTTVDPSGMRYLYVPGARLDSGMTPIAFEPGLYGEDRLALFSDGTIRKLPISVIQAAMPKEAR